MAAIVLSKENFEAEVLNSDIPVLVDFSASWCGPCQMLAPIIEEIADEAGDFKVGKVETSEEMDLAIEYRVSSIPCLVVFKGGKEVKRSVGAIPKQAILELMK